MSLLLVLLLYSNLKSYTNTFCSEKINIQVFVVKRIKKFVYFRPILAKRRVVVAFLYFPLKKKESEGEREKVCIIIILANQNQSV